MMKFHLTVVMKSEHYFLVKRELIEGIQVGFFHPYMLYSTFRAIFPWFVSYASSEEAIQERYPGEWIPCTPSDQWRLNNI